MFGKILNILWQPFCQSINVNCFKYFQTLKKQSSHLVTLANTATAALAIAAAVSNDLFIGDSQCLIVSTCANYFLSLIEYIDSAPSRADCTQRVIVEINDVMHWCLSIKKWANPGLFVFYFGLFKQTIQFLQQINMKKCHFHPVKGAGI